MTELEQRSKASEMSPCQGSRSSESLSEGWGSSGEKEGAPSAMLEVFPVLTHGCVHV